MHQHGYIGRKMRLPDLAEKPAIILAPFGSARRGKVALEMMADRVAAEFPDCPIYWAYSSAIIRKKEGRMSLHQALAQAEEDGARRVIVQPLHIFPGTEYQQMAETCAYFPGIRTFLGETLLHRWDYIHSMLEVLQQELLVPEDGMNLLALHGTPLAADRVNIVYLGLERLISDLLPNTFIACVEGIPSIDGLLARFQKQQTCHDYRRIRIIPMMFLAGVHVEDDIMGMKNSWRNSFLRLGLDVDCPSVQYQGKAYLKGLGFYPEVIDFFIDRLKRTFELTRYY